MGAPELLDDKAVFDAIAKKISSITGVQLGEKQESLVYSRLSKHMRNLGGMTPKQYWEYFSKHETEEIPILISLLTTHHTFFFREKVHFTFLEKELPQLVKAIKERNRKTIRIWCAASSRGQEGYTIAMFMDYHLKKIAAGIDYSILFSDVDQESVKYSRAATYPHDELNKIPLNYRSNHWQRCSDSAAEYSKAKPSLLQHCEFRVINLLHLDKIFFQEKFDIIFCRNVFIYFTSQEVERTTRQLISHLGDPGLLIIGVSESLLGMKLPLHLAGRSVYRMSSPSSHPQLSKAKPEIAHPTSMPVLPPAKNLLTSNRALHPVFDNTLRNLRQKLNLRLQASPSASAELATKKPTQLTMDPRQALPGSMQAKSILLLQKNLTLGFQFRKLISELPGYKSVGCEMIASADEAMARIKDKHPDILVIDGAAVSFLRLIREKYPLPVLIIKTESQPHEDFSLWQHASEVAWLDHSFRQANAEQSNILRQTLANIAGRHHGSFADKKPIVAATNRSPSHFDTSLVIAMGASTGGTEALTKIISELPAGMPPILIVQHIPEGFSRAFASRLDQMSQLTVREAQDGDQLRPGEVLVAPGDKHMEILGRAGHYRVRVYEGEKVSGHRPSVNVLFRSVARTVGKKAIGLILTGMGSDGAEGLLSLKEKGGRTFGQDARTSVVYGMPKVAFQLGAVEFVLPLQKIAAELQKSVTLKS